MNDFTKEELKKIYKNLEGDASNDHAGELIVDKIQSMIDNYCEHKKSICSFICEECDKLI